MSRLALAALLAATALATAHAAEDPKVIRGSDDTRLREIDYNDHQLYRLTSTNYQPLVITYLEGEVPDFIAGTKVIDVSPPEQKDGDKGDKKQAELEARAKQLQEECKAAGWCAIRSNNQLTLQPMKDDDGSLLTVTTQTVDQSGNVVSHRYYRYELHTRKGQLTDLVEESTGKDGKLVSVVKGHADALAYFSVAYTNRAETAAKRAAAWRQAHPGGELSEAARKRTDERLQLGNFAAYRNGRWKLNDSEACKVIGPYDVTDNGQSTTLKFRMNAPVSIPNIVHNDDTESLARFDNQTGPNSEMVMIVHGVPGRLDPNKPAMILRRGKTEACGLYNFGYNPNASAPNTGTDAPDVIRETRR